MREKRRVWNLSQIYSWLNYWWWSFRDDEFEMKLLVQKTILLLKTSWICCDVLVQSRGFHAIFQVSSYMIHFWECGNCNGFIYSFMSELLLSSTILTLNQRVTMRASFRWQSCFRLINCLLLLLLTSLQWHLIQNHWKSDFWWRSSTIELIWYDDTPS